MKTDHPIYQYLATGIEAFRVLTNGIILTDDYQFSSTTLKNIERRIDALFIPQDNKKPIYIIEFQAKIQLTSWYNLMAKVGLYGEENPGREVHGIMIVPNKRTKKSKANLSKNAYPVNLSTVHLGDFLPALLKQTPLNPFVAVLAPLLLNDKELIQQATQLWEVVHTTALSNNVRVNLEQILIFWLFERFKHLTEQEILDMLHILTPLEETRAYQSILSKGILKGKIEGEAIGVIKGKVEGKVEGEAFLLKRQIIRRFKTLPKWAEIRIDKANIAQIEEWAEAIFDANSIEQLLNKDNE